MILIPSLETVVLLVPRTGSGSLKRAVLKRHPDAMLIYRHMEADGVPAGYDRWRRVGVLRHPVDRLWSLYKFCKTFSNGYGHTAGDKEIYERQIRESVAMSFEDWLVTNNRVFTNPYASVGMAFYPQFNVRHSLPENRKSQFVYLRPDLGTQIYRFEDQLPAMQKLLDVDMPKTNDTLPDPVPAMRPSVWDVILDRFAWDIEAGGYKRGTAA